MRIDPDSRIIERRGIRGKREKGYGEKLDKREREDRLKANTARTPRVATPAELLGSRRGGSSNEPCN